MEEIILVRKSKNPMKISFFDFRVGVVVVAVGVVVVAACWLVLVNVHRCRLVLRMCTYLAISL